MKLGYGYFLTNCMFSAYQYRQDPWIAIEFHKQTRPLHASLIEMKAYGPG